VHDRRIDGETEIFGNAGALFMSAMTWYDHSTVSTWSQPWGRAIQGERKGIELFLLPSQIATWSSWLEAHPETLVMVNDTELLGAYRQKFDPDFVIGLLLDGHAKAYPYRDVEAVGVINDDLGPYPVLLWAQDERFHAYLRTVDGRELTFRMEGDGLIDEETGSTWDIARGRAVDGPLKGAVLQGVPSSSAFDWAWLDFYPASDFYTP